MRRTRTTILGLLVAGLSLAGLLALPYPAAAQGGAGVDLSWWTVDGGGGTLGGEGYALSGTLGQAEAKTWQGGGYTLSGGFWDGGEQSSGGKHRIYLPVVLRQ